MQSHRHRSVQKTDASCVRATAATQIGQRGRTCTCGHSVPSRACCSYTTRCCPGEWMAPRAWFLWRWRPRSLEHILHRRFGGLGGSCTTNSDKAEGRNEALIVSVFSEWRAALVLPQARRVLETHLRRLARGATILHSAFCLLHFGVYESLPRELKGPEAFSHFRPASWRSQPWLKAPPSNKEQTPLGDPTRSQPAVSRRLFRCLRAHLLRSPWIVKSGSTHLARLFADGHTPPVENLGSPALVLVLCRLTPSRCRLRFVHRIVHLSFLHSIVVVQGK